MAPGIGARLVRWSAALAASLTLAAGSAAALSPEEIRERRGFRPRPGAERWLGLPSRILDLPWAPLRRALDWAQRHDAPKRIVDSFYFDRAHTMGWFPAVGSRGSGTGFGAVLFVDDRREKGERLELKATSPGGGQLFGRLSWHRPAGSWRLTGVSVEFSRDRELEVYVSPEGRLGMGTSAADLRAVGLERASARLSATRGLGGGAQAGGFVGAEAARPLRPLGGSAAEPPLGSAPLERVALAGGGVRAELDAAPGASRAERGWRSSLEWAAAGEPGGRTAVLREAAHGAAFVPLWAPGRVLALRAAWTRVRQAGRAPVPFYLAPALDLHSGLRSYPTGRFRNQGAVSASADYRYPIWRAWDLFAFLDAGQTVGSGEPLASSRWRASKGGGCRLFAGDREMLLLQWGFGAEGREWVLAVGKAF